MAPPTGVFFSAIGCAGGRITGAPGVFLLHEPCGGEAKTARPKAARPQTAHSNAGDRKAGPSEAAPQGAARQESDCWSLEETQRRLNSLDRQIRANVDDADLVCSEPAEQPLGGRANRARICEQLIRDMRRSSGRRIVGHDRSGRTLDPADETVDTALRRLEEELQRLTNPLARQSRQLQSQAARITRAAI